MPRLLSVNNYHYRRGGSEAVYFGHAELFERSGWENAYFSMRHPENTPSPWSKYFVDEIQYGHSYSAIQKAAKAIHVIYSFDARKRLGDLLNDYPADVAHLHNIYHHLSPSILPVLADRGIPVVLTAHDLKIACPSNRMYVNGETCERCKVHKYYQAVNRRCIQDSRLASAIIALESTLHWALRSYRRHVNRIVSPSRFMIEKFVEWGWPRDLFAHVPNYVAIPEAGEPVGAGNYLAYFGRLVPEKGLSSLVRASAVARVPVAIIGTGPLRQELEELARSCGAEVDFKGFLSGDALRRAILDSRATVMPSEWYENFPIAALESMALGRPVIGARIGGLPEIVRDGVTGWLYESGNVDDLAGRLRSAYDASHSTLAALGDEARRMVQREYSAPRYRDTMMALYRSLGIAC